MKPVRTGVGSQSPSVSLDLNRQSPRVDLPAAPPVEGPPPVSSDGYLGASTLTTGSVASSVTDASTKAFAREIEGALDRVLAGSSKGDELHRLVTDGWWKKGVLTVQLSDAWLDRLPKPDGTGWRRYGSEEKEIFGFPLAGKPGQAGAVQIRTEGEAAGLLDFEDFRGPPHVHEHADHLSVVTEGAGMFFVVRPTAKGPTLYVVPVERGWAALIPQNVPHTFKANPGTKFGVMATTTSTTPTNDPAFLRMVDADELRAMPRELRTPGTAAAPLEPPAPSDAAVGNGPRQAAHEHSGYCG